MSTISYLIRWFRENTNELVEDLGVGFPLAQHNTDRTLFTTMSALPTAITQTSLPAPAHSPYVVTTPTQTNAAQQSPAVIAVMGVVIVIISLVAVRVIVILFIKWRQSTNSNKS